MAGRLAARTGQVPVYGNLLHHGVEMYLKGALIGTITVHEMKRRSHRLPALWDLFKKKVNDPTLNRFDATITALHAFESIRYPDDLVTKGLLGSIAWVPHHATLWTGSGKMPPKYEVIISRIDELMIEVLGRCSVNPKYFSGRLLGSGAAEAFAYQNPRAADWS